MNTCFSRKHTWCDVIHQVSYIYVLSPIHNYLEVASIVFLKFYKIMTKRSSWRVPAKHSIPRSPINTYISCFALLHDSWWLASICNAFKMNFSQKPWCLTTILFAGSQRKEYHYLSFCLLCLHLLTLPLTHLIPNCRREISDNKLSCLSM